MLLGLFMLMRMRRMPHSSRKHAVFSRYASHKFIALCFQGVEPFYVRRLKPTHGIKSFSWTCCGLILSFGFTTLNLLSCGIGISDASARAVTSDVAISFYAGFVSYPPLPDACSDTGGSRCLRWSVLFRVLSVPI